MTKKELNEEFQEVYRNAIEMQNYYFQELQRLSREAELPVYCSASVNMMQLIRSGKYPEWMVMDRYDEYMRQRVCQELAEKVLVATQK